MEREYLLDKQSGDGDDGSRTGPEVKIGKTTQLAMSVRPDFGYVFV